MHERESLTGFTAEQGSLSTTGTGTINFTVIDQNGDLHMFSIENVHYVPESHKLLLATDALTQNGFIFHQDQTGSYIWNQSAAEEKSSRFKLIRAEDRLLIGKSILPTVRIMKFSKSLRTAADTQVRLQ